MARNMGQINKDQETGKEKEFPFRELAEFLGRLKVDIERSREIRRELATVVVLQNRLIELMTDAAEGEKLDGVPIAFIMGPVGEKFEELMDEIELHLDKLDTNMPGFKGMLH